MVTAKQLLSTIESTLLVSTTPSPSQRIELIHAIRHSLPSLRTLLSFPPPKPSDRAQVQLKEVRLPNSGPIPLDDQDVQIALKLSDDLHLNEIDCVRLLVSANQEWGLQGRGPLDILRLTAGLWYTERRDLITALYTLLRAIVLDQGLEVDLQADILKYVEDLINGGLRQRLISLIKELNREEPAGLGGPNSDRYILDSRGALVERRAVVCRERLILGHCLVLSLLVVRASPKDVKDIYTVLKDSVGDTSGSTDIVKNQITYSLLFSLIISLISDALGASPDHMSILSQDTSFRHEFHETVMAIGNDPTVEGCIVCVRLAWAVHLMIIQETTDSRDDGRINSCLEVVFSSNVFQFFLNSVLRTPSYQNDDEDMIYMYNAYLHKLITSFLSHPLARDKVKETKEQAMTVLSPYKMSGSHDFVLDGNKHSQQASESFPQTFVSLLEFVSEIYEKEPELLSGNDVIWTFVTFAGEDHTNFQTLVAFLKMLSTMASSEEGASKVYELLQGRTFRSISWSTLFDCLSIYEEKFKQSSQSGGPILPEIQEGDAKALVAYLCVLRKVLENGNPIERKTWFPDIEPLFKLLSYENVPPYLKGALRNSISTFIHVSPNLKDTIWGFLEQYDLPVVVGPQAGQIMGSQVYDMRFELNEVEARSEHYPSTISFLNLLNALIAEERDAADRGRRFIGIFRFIYDHVFGPFSQRAYADPSEKWQLGVACLQHFQMILSMYDIKDEDADIVASQTQLMAPQSTPLQMQLPVIELLKDFMSGKTVFRNIMGILLPGVDAIIADRTNRTYGLLLEKAVLLSLEIIILVLERDLLVSDFWRPLYQPFDVILSQDHNQIVALLEYIRYDFHPQLQQLSIKLMSILSSRMVGFVPLLLKSNSAGLLVEDYAACLELRSEGCQVIENSSDDPGVLIMQLLIDNISRPAPNITHFLLRFDLDSPVERTVLQPKFNYSCLKVILDTLEMLPKPDINSMLHEFGFQLLYELCSDPLTSGPTIDLLSTKKYHFFVKHLDNIGLAPLPKRNNTQSLRISSLHQRAWLLKLFALELHIGNVTSPTHRDVCHNIIAHLFGLGETGYHSDNNILLLQGSPEDSANRAIGRSKVLDLLEIVQFRCPDITMKHSEVLSHTKFGPVADDILGNPLTQEKGGVYYYSERGDRLIDLNAFRDTLWQKCNFDNPQLSSFGSEAELNEVRSAVQQLLRWGYKHNKNLEEQAAQLHMLTSWSQIVEIAASRRMSPMENRSEILFQLLDASLNASSSPDCSLKMALILTQVSITCMTKLRDERFVGPSVLNSDTVTCLDVIMTKRLSNGACHSILYKIMMAILRHDTSEALRRRQYTLLLSYLQYCQHILDPDVPTTVLQSLLMDEQESADLDLEKVDQDQAELARANLSIIRKEAQSILDLAIKDATQGSESGKIMALFVLDALICIDHEKFFLSQLQSRGFLRSCLMSLSNISYQDSMHSIDPLQRLCALEAELALLLRISHKYGKSGAQILFSMGAFEHISTCMTQNMQVKGNPRRFDSNFGKDSFADVHRQRMVVSPSLRLVFSLTSLIETTDFFEVKNKIVREVVDFVKGHQLLFDQVIRQDVSDADDLAMEQMNLVVGILSKVWPYEEGAEYGFVQGLFGLMHSLFSRDSTSLSLAQTRQRMSELSAFRLCFSLSSYLYFLVKRKSLRLQLSNNSTDYSAPAGQQQPTLSLLGFLLNSVTTALENAAEEKSLLLNKIQDINELPRQEVDEIIKMCVLENQVASSDNIQKRRYIAMVEMCRVAGNRDRLIILVLLLAENLLNIFLIHFQNSSISDSSQAVKALAYGSTGEIGEDLESFCSKLIPILERLELLKEDKVGHNLKVFQRLASSLKELTIQKLGL
uniref:nuclear pore complex protein NUP205 isoform X2 n=1 Tax=Erigeron canadensis TaxID=72917 RepID=UPI001CB8EBCA|nr:nuclear pore complex protein NUP205 isoform X2 [Erigeron canadensis]